MKEESGGGSSDGTEEFERALTKVVLDAVHAGVPVEGAWDVDTEDGSATPEFTVEISEVDRKS